MSLPPRREIWQALGPVPDHELTSPDHASPSTDHGFTFPDHEFTSPDHEIAQIWDLWRTWQGAMCVKNSADLLVVICAANQNRRNSQNHFDLRPQKDSKPRHKRRWCVLR
eukprot:8317793-Pyramimonas_sp.AAC.1